MTIRAQDTDKQLAAFLAKTDKALSAALSQFRASSLTKVLKDSEGHKIDLKWVVSNLADVALNAKKDSDRLAAMDRLTDLLRLAALQDPAFAKDAAAAAAAIGRSKKQLNQDRGDPFGAGRIRYGKTVKETG